MLFKSLQMLEFDVQLALEYFSISGWVVSVRKVNYTYQFN